jgi:hypothetical protein
VARAQTLAFIRYNKAFIIVFDEGFFSFAPSGHNVSRKKKLKKREVPQERNVHFVISGGISIWLLLRTLRRSVILFSMAQLLLPSSTCLL